MSEHKALYLVAVDGSTASRRALMKAIELTKAANAMLIIAHIIPWSGYTPIGIAEAYARPLEKKQEEENAYDEVLQPAMTEARAAGIAFDELHTWGTPAQIIKETVEQRGVDMVILGRKGRSNLGDLLVGSVTNALAHNCPCPVLIVP